MSRNAKAAMAPLVQLMCKATTSNSIFKSSCDKTKSSKCANSYCSQTNCDRHHNNMSIIIMPIYPIQHDVILLGGCDG